MLKSTVLVGILVKSYLPETAVLVIIAAIFNQYGPWISTPFQALVFFLAEYCDFDVNKHYITIYGVRNINDLRQGKESTSKTGKYLVDETLIESYYQHVKLTSTAALFSGDCWKYDGVESINQ